MPRSLPTLCSGLCPFLPILLLAGEFMSTSSNVITAGILSSQGPKATCQGLGGHTERLPKCVLVGEGTVVLISGDSRTLINSQMCSGA